MMSLKDWFVMSGRSCDDSTATTINTTTTSVTTKTSVTTTTSSSSSSSSSSIPRILLLDGGVSTHLEEKIRCHCSSSCDRGDDGIDTSSTRSTTTTTTTTSDNNNEQQNTGDVVVFPYRELWSSSLLLTENGRQHIYDGHLDWLQIAKVNVITTVTYQCHYIPSLWPKQPPQKPTSMMNDDKRNDDQRSTPIITKEIMDQMWYDGIRLAQQAVVQTTTVADDGPIQRLRYVVASSGCYGAALSNGAEYTGIYNTISSDDETNITLSQTIYHFHLHKLQTILRQHDPPVSGIAIETVPSYMECEILRDLFTSNDDMEAVALRDSMKDVACYICLSCRNGTQLNDGTLLIDAIRILRDIPTTYVQAIGLNCTSIRYIPDLIRTLLTEIVQYTPHRGIVIFPNSGELWDGTTKQWYPDPELQIASSFTTNDTSFDSNTAQTLMTQILYQIDTIWEELCQVDTTVRLRRKLSILIGGCCRMKVETIAALRILVDEYLLRDDIQIPW